MYFTDQFKNDKIIIYSTLNVIGYEYNITVKRNFKKRRMYGMSDTERPLKDDKLKIFNEYKQ